MRRLMTVLLAFVIPCFAPAQNTSAPIQIKTLAQSSTSWDGTPYEAYPSGRPELTVLKITIPPNTIMKWHTHSLPNAGYVLSGELTVEKKDGTKRHFVAGQVIPEIVDTAHRGVTGAKPAVLIVFYPGTPGLPVSK